MMSRLDVTDSGNHPQTAFFHLISDKIVIQPDIPSGYLT